MSDPWDAVVVGGGPAGSATAARLAAKGLRVIVLDREAFPRPKACGECLSPAAVAALERLGALGEVLTRPHAKLSGWKIIPHLGHPFAGNFPPGQDGLAISRSELDDALLAFAGARGAVVSTGTRVLGLIAEGGRVCGVRARRGRAVEEIRARVVIGADGLRSVVLRALGLIRREPRLRKLALTAHLSGHVVPSSEGALRLFPWGCLGVAVVAEGVANVTVVLNPDRSRGAAGRKEECFDSIVAASGVLPAAQRCGEVLATGPFDWAVRSAVADGAILVGDAAGYYDPFTGQGIFRALRGAELAADALTTALSKDDLSRSHLARYDSAQRREFSPGVRLQHVIESFLSRPRILRPMSSRLARRPDLADTLIGATGDLLPVRSLLAPRMVMAALLG